MADHWIFTLFIYALMACILFSLGSGLYFILFKRDDPQKAVRALTVRISLSLVLFIILMIGFGSGWLKPHHLFITNTQKQTEITTPHPQSANTTPPPQSQNGVSE